MIFSAMCWKPNSSNKTSTGLYLFSVSLLLFTCQQIFAEQIIEIYGEYNASAYNPRTHQPYIDDRHVHVAFVAIISGNTWKICATNLDNKTTGQLWYNGENTYTLNTVSYGEPRSNAVVATVSPSPFYLAGAADYLDISVPWLTYGLSPNTIILSKKGVLDIPLPWLTPRYRPEAYGYKWIITPTSDGWFLDKCVVVRDVSLDLDEKEEFLRPELVYPDTLENLNRYKLILGLRKAIPDGFIEARYECTEWYRTNNISIPLRSEFKYFMNPHYSFPCFEGSLAATKVIVRNERENILPEVSKPTQVIDFRYRKANSTRIFRGALYALNPGESWRFRQ